MKNQREINPLVRPKYRSFWKLALICMNACLSSFFVGYSLMYVGSLHEDKFGVTVAHRYDIYLSSSDNSTNSFKVTKAIVNGLITFGAMFGAILSSQLIKRVSRRNSFLVTNVIAVVALLMIAYIPNKITFITGRFLQGICTGIFSAIVPLYINQIVTPDAENLGSLNQMFIAGAQAFSNLWYLILFSTSKDDIFIWKMLVEFPLILIILQTVVFLFVFPFETPKYLYEKGLRKEAAELIDIIYSQEHSDEAISKFESSIQSDLIDSVGSRNRENMDESDGRHGLAVKNSLAGDPHRKLTNSRMAIIFALHIALLQQLSGVNAIVIYGKKILSQTVGHDNYLAIDLLSILITSIPAFMAFATIKVMKKRGRKFLIQLGVAISCICLAAMALSFFIKKESTNTDFFTFVIIASMFIFMLGFGLTLGPVVWLYIPEIVEPNIIPFSTMFNLSGATICIVGFSLLDGYQGIVIAFSGFFIWCLVSLGLNAKVMVETKDKSREKIFEQFREKKVC